MMTPIVNCPKCGKPTNLGGGCDCPPSAPVAGSGFSQKDAERKRFEQWITSPLLEKDVSRWPTSEKTHAWPGQYRDYEVQLAWEAWTQAQNPKITGA